MEDLPKFDVDMRGSCSACGGMHFGTGRVCVYKQTFPEIPETTKAPAVNVEKALYLALKDVLLYPDSIPGEQEDAALKAITLYESKGKL